MISVLLISASSCTFTSRYILLNVPDVYDYKKLPVRTVKTVSNQAFKFYQSKEPGMTKIAPFVYNNVTVKNLDSFLENSKTTAFIVIRNDSILYENYFKGHTHNTYCKAFSASKVFISAMIGIAIDEGYIQSVNDPVLKYIPEIKDKRFSTLTISHCLALSSGIKTNNKQAFPWHDKVRIYYTKNLRGLISGIDYGKEPGKEYYAEEWSPVILALILERATGRNISSYLEEKIWKPLGMENDALFVTDTRINGFEAANSGLIALPLDFARFGRLYLNKGIWNNQSIVPSAWIANTAMADTTSLSFYRRIQHYEGRDVYFNSMWWGLRKDNKNSEYTASGHFGQRIYVSPEKNVVVVRFGTKDGDIDWTGFIMKLVETL